MVLIVFLNLWAIRRYNNFENVVVYKCDVPTVIMPRVVYCLESDTTLYRV